MVLLIFSITAGRMMASGGSNSALESATLGPVDDVTKEASDKTAIDVESTSTDTYTEEVQQIHGKVVDLDPSTSVQPDKTPFQPSIPEAEFGAGVTDSTYQSRVFTSIGDIFQQDKLTDLMLMAEGQSIPCHKILLAGASEYFRTKFTSETNTLENQLLEIEDLSCQTLKLIVSYLYTGNINVTVDNAKDILPACKTLKLQSLYDTCEKHFIDILDPQNCIGLHKVAELHDIPTLKEKAKQVMLNKFSDVLTSQYFREMEEEDIVEYIQDENLQVSDENVVFDAVVAWVKYDADSRQGRFLELMKHVRLQYCTQSYLRDVVAEEPLMQSLEAQNMLTTASLRQNQQVISPCKKQKDLSSVAAPRKSYNRESTLLLLGGLGDSHCYLLENDKWKQIEGSQIPNGIWGYSACLVTDGVLISGGYKNNAPTNECWLFSISAFQWRPMPKLNTPRARHGSTCLGTHVYVVGGIAGISSCLSSVEYLGSNGTWAVVAGLPKELSSPLITSYNQNIYVLNGRYDYKNWRNDKEEATAAFVYDLYTRQWVQLAKMPIDKDSFEHGSVAVLGRTIYVISGDGRFLSFDPILNMWTELTRCDPYANTAAFAWKGRVLVSGGQSNSGRDEDIHRYRTSCIMEYNPGKNEWTGSSMTLPKKMSSHFIFPIGGKSHQ